MKSIRYIVWILSAALVITTLDTIPDPPAVNPRASLSAVVHLHDYSGNAVARRSDVLTTPSLLPVSWIAFRAGEPRPGSDEVVLTGQAGDPSPPTFPNTRKPSFQS
ncbi:MAG: hypothetical protein ACRD5L_16210 [Bryobacteraceae bacterium]